MTEPFRHLHSYFEDVAAAIPSRRAVWSDCSGWLTFAEINSAASALAAELLRRGIGRQARLGIVLPRSPAAVIAVLAAWKVGASYVPVNQAASVEQAQFVLSHAAVDLVLTNPDWSGPALSGFKILFVDDAVHRSDKSPPMTGVPVDGEDIAWILYTSGSTGRPKGVAGPHRALTGRCAWMWNAYPFGPDEVSVQNTQLTVVDSYWELWGSLAKGVPVVLPPHDAFKDPHCLIRLLAAHDVTRICVVPSMLRALLEVFDSLGNQLPRLRHWVSSGEKLDAALVKRFYRQCPDAVLLNQYGLTETCADVTSFDTRLLNPNTEGAVPIGRTMGRTRAYIVDKELRLVPPQDFGELCVSGESIACGYFNDPDLTPARFVPNPFDPAGGPLLRTGDLVRDLGDGILEQLGRLDRQVKIRGFRVEPEGIEAVLAHHPKVSAVAIWPSEAPEPRLTASVVAADPRNPPASVDLRSFLADRLPDYQVPAAFEFLDRLPLTPSGKVDLGALRGHPRGRFPSVADAGTPLELDLLRLWRDLLKWELVDIQDNFFELGGNSLDLVRLLSAVAKRWKRRVSHAEFVRQPTICALAKLIEDCAEAAPDTDGRTDDHRHGWRALSAVQERMWNQERQPNVQSGLNNISLAFRLRGQLRVDALRAAINAVVAAHDALRTVFMATESGPRQRAVSSACDALHVIERCEIDEALRRARCHRFDLSRAPLFDARIMSLGAADNLLVLTVHHLVCDGRSLGVLLADITEGYEMACDDRAIALQASSFGHVDDETDDARDVQDRRRFPPICLTTDRPPAARRTGRGAAHEFEIAPPLAARVAAAAKELGVTDFVMWCGAVGLALSNLTEQEQFELAIPVAHRSHAESRRIIGCLMRTAALGIDLSSNPTVAEYLHRVQAATWRAPFYGMAAAPPLEQSSVMVAYDDAHASTFSLRGLNVQPIRGAGESAKLDLTILLDRASDRLYGRIEFDIALFDHATVATLAGCIRIAVERLCNNHTSLLASLSLVDDMEKAQMAAWNATQRSSFPLGASLHTLIEGSIAKHPNAKASFGHKSRSYSEMDAAANRLARTLLGRGLSLGDVVGVHMDRSFDLLVCVLAVLKAGGVYLPLQADLSIRRLTDYVEDSAARLILSDQPTTAWIESSAFPRVVSLSDLKTEAAAASRAPLESIGGPDSNAYIIFTSGSTGRPKGVVVTHRSIVNRLSWLQETFPLTEADCHLLKTPIGADPSVEEIVWPLLSGARLEIAIPDGHRDPAYLAQVIIAAGVTTIRFVPSMLGLFLDHPLAASCTSLKRIFSGGEVLPPDLAVRTRRMLPAELHNFYGPTEATIDITWWPVPPDVSAHHPIPIGRPVANSEALVLDRHGHLVPIGAPGELHLGGVQVARGYINRPALTAENFIAHPFQPGQRIYRTGDLARWRRDGNLEFLGRLDRQVQIAGVRVEPLEVEMALRSHHAIRDAIVVPDHERSATKLIAYIQVRPGTPVEPRELRRHLRARLPLMMVPSSFIEVAEIPRLANGKVDRTSLPAAIQPAEYRAAPRSGEEVLTSPIERRAVAWRILEQVLGGPIEAGVGFIDAGGDSFSAIKVCSEINRTFGSTLPVHVLLECRSFEEFLGRIEANLVSKAAGGVNPSPALLANRPETSPVSLLQERWLGLARQGLGHVDMLAEVQGPVTADHFSRAVSCLVERHAILRSRYEYGTPPLQQVIAGWRPDARVTDLRGCSEEERRAGAIAAVERSLITFDIEREAPFDMELLLVEPDRCLLVGRMHHIATDGWSTSIRLEDFERVYAELETGRDPAMLPLPPQYADYAKAQREFSSSDRFLEAQDWFRRTFAGSEGPTRMPSTQQPETEKTPRWPAAYVNFVQPSSVAATLAAYGRQRGSTLFTVLMSAFTLMLQQATGQSDFVFTTSLAGRHAPGADQTLGVFVNPLPIRIRTGGAAKIETVHRAARESFLGLVRHQDYMLADLVQHVPPFVGRCLQDTSHIHLLFQNFPSPPRDGRRRYQIFDFQDTSLARPFGIPIPPHNLVREFELIIFRRLDGALSFNFGYRRSRFTRQEVEMWADMYRKILEQVIAELQG